MRCGGRGGRFSQKGEAGHDVQSGPGGEGAQKRLRIS